VGYNLALYGSDMTETTTHYPYAVRQTTTTDTKQRHAQNAHLFATIESPCDELACIDARLATVEGYPRELLLNYRDCVEYEGLLRAQQQWSHR